jgi:hypothetical protein
MLLCCLLMPEELGPPEASWTKRLSPGFANAIPKSPPQSTSIIPFSSSPQRNTEARTGLDFLLPLTLTWTAVPSP